MNHYKDPYVSIRILTNQPGWKNWICADWILLLHKVGSLRHALQRALMRRGDDWKCSESPRERRVFGKTGRGNSPLKDGVKGVVFWKFKGEGEEEDSDFFSFKVVCVFSAWFLSLLLLIQFCWLIWGVELVTFPDSGVIAKQTQQEAMYEHLQLDFNEVMVIRGDQVYTPHDGSRGSPSLFHIRTIKNQKGTVLRTVFRKVRHWATTLRSLMAHHCKNGPRVGLIVTQISWHHPKNMESRWNKKFPSWFLVKSLDIQKGCVQIPNLRVVAL